MSVATVRKRRVVLSTVSSDSHTWNLVFLQLLLEELECEVVNLGACVPDEVIVGAVRTHAPNLLVISSVNGHGHIDGVRMIGLLRADGDPAVAGLPVIIGGKLGIQGAADVGLARELMGAGFNAVFTDGADPAEIGDVLEQLSSVGEPALPAGVVA